MRRHVTPIGLAIVLVLGLVLGCSRSSEPRRPTAASPTPAAKTSPSPAAAAEAVLAADGSAPLPDAAGAAVMGTRVLHDPETGQPLPPGLVAVLETGPGGPVAPDEIDLLFEEPAHRGRIPITLSGASVIDLAPMRPIESGSPGEEEPVLPGAPASLAPDAD